VTASVKQDAFILKFWETVILPPDQMTRCYPSKKLPKQITEQSIERLIVIQSSNSPREPKFIIVHASALH
jgi:hypothetical protein